MPADNEKSLRDELESAFEDFGDDSDPSATKDAEPDKKPAKSDGERSAKPDDAPKSDAKQPDREPAKSDGKAADAGPKFSYKDPPSRWSPEHKEAWAKTFGALDDGNPTHKQIGALRDMMFQRASESEAEFSKRVEEVEGRAKSLEAVNKVIEPFRGVVERSGETVEKALGDLLQVNQFATDRPEEFLKWFVKNRGLDVTKIFGSAPSQAAAEQPSAGDADDPFNLIPQAHKDAVKLLPQLAQKIQQLEAQLGQVGTHVNTFQQNAQQQEVARASQYIAGWSAEVDAAGNLLRPHYADPNVKREMLRLIETGVETEMNKAYDRAVWSDPTVRERILATQSAAKIAENERKARDEAARKRAAASSIGGRPAMGSTPAPTNSADAGSIRSALLDAWNEAASGV